MPNRHSRWQSLIQVSPNEHDTLALVRRYLGSLSETEMMRIPAACRPSLPSSREEVATWAVALVTAEMKFTGETAASELLQQLALVFSEANTRFAQLAQDARETPPNRES
jgi:3-methyladenine DNA glycosylase Tag